MDEVKGEPLSFQGRVSLIVVTTQVTNNHERKNQGSIKMTAENSQISMYCNTLTLLLNIEINTVIFL
jgi:hypothetical protein